MISKQTRDWVRLDNAAMMFPAGVTSRNTRVFRFTCELNEDVDPAILQQALDEMVKNDPGFVCAMRNGLFWHYLERSRDMPTVHREKHTPCISIYSADSKRLLFYVSYYRRRVHVEMFHALTDGTGALMFFRMLVIRYLRLAHAAELGDSVPPPDYGAPRERLQEDSFAKHYSRSAGMARIKMPRAYQIKGALTEDKHYVIIEGAVSTAKVLELARAHGTTVTGILGALYISSIARGMGGTERALPVVLSVPVNLRSFFDSETIRNFFVTTNFSYSFAERDGSLEDILSAISEFLASAMTREAVTTRMDSMVALQRNFAMRCAPLFLKDIAIGTSKKLNEKGETAVITNVGRVDIPPQLMPYIKQFSATSATSNMHLCVISCGDRMLLTFSSSFRENDVARRFFRALADEGINAEITSNYNQD